MIHPSIGRRVWFWPDSHDTHYENPDRIAYYDPAQPCDAGIAYVHNDRLVNLTVADQNGVMHSRTSVTLLQDLDEPPAGGARHAQWMPYQVKAAT